MAFFQAPPQLGNQFDEDPMLPSWIARFMPATKVAEELHELGNVAVECYAKQLADLNNEPVLTQWDAWGHRVDTIEVSPLWKRAAVVAAERGLVATAYERRTGDTSRLRIRPTIPELQNAYYDRSHGELRFGLFTAGSTVAGRNIPGGQIAVIDGYPREANLAHRNMVIESLPEQESTGLAFYLPGSPLKMSISSGLALRRVPALDADRKLSGTFPTTAGWANAVGAGSDAVCRPPMPHRSTRRRTACDRRARSAASASRARARTAASSAPRK